MVSGKRGRLGSVDVAKGFAITLVVWGHIVAGPQPLGNYWYQLTQDLVYLFHMPFFMFLSGMVAGYGYQPVRNVNGWLIFVQKKALRLLPAYCLLAIVVVLGKTIASKFLFVDNIPASLFGGIFDVLFRPAVSSAKSLWFIYVLFLFYLSLHPLMFVFRQRFFVLLLFAVVLQFADFPDFLLLDRYSKFLQFFVLGMLAGSHYSEFDALLARWGRFAVVIFAALATSALLFPYALAKVVVGMASIPALFYCIERLELGRLREVLLKLGKYSFVIYLFNTIFIGLVKAVGFKLLNWNGFAFLIFAPTMFAAGLFLPIVLKRQYFVRLPWLNKITD